MAVFLLLALLGAPSARAGAADGPPHAPDFPRSLERYTGEEGLSLGDVLVRRAEAEPLNVIATLIFLLAVVHTFLAPHFLALSHRLRERVGPDGHSFRAEILHFFGEVEAVFGIWVVPLLGAIALAKGWRTADAFVHHGVDFTEAVFVVVIMAIASTRPILDLAERVMGLVAALGGRSLAAWWISILTVGPLLGSFITEPGAMTISALLLGRQIYEREPSRRFAYATLGLLFVNVSIGGTLTHFAAPPVLMVAGTFGWGLGFMLQHFGWKAVLAIAVSNGLYALLFRRELASLARTAPARPEAEPGGAAAAVPAWITATHVGFLAWTVFAAHTPALVVAAFLFFLAFVQATAPHQEGVNLRPPLLVGFFLAGLVVHGAVQKWWIAPILGRLGAGALFWSATVLTAFNDNAAITYLASLVPGLTAAMKYAVVAGAVTGGGLTVIANAPNPAGQSILSKYFPDGVSPASLALWALVPTLVAAACFVLL